MYDPIVDLLHEYDSDDGEFVATLFSVFQSLVDSETRRVVRRRSYINRDRHAAHERLVSDYFADDCLYTEQMFATRFRVSKPVFLRICNTLESRFVYMQQRVDARGRVGFSTLQKCTAAIRYLGYGIAFDASDEYLKMSERTARECVAYFCHYVVAVFGKEYLRVPTKRDIEKLYAAHEAKHGLPGMIGSLDCTHWEWEKCPTAWQGQYTRGDIGVASFILEAVASHDLWIWHSFFGVAGANNDRNVLQRSPIFNDIWMGKSPDTSFMVNGNYYEHGYYLCDLIYPDFSTFVKSFAQPRDQRTKKFAEKQESARKDVERAFGVLKQKWHVVKHAARLWDNQRITTIMYACIIMHNMMVEDKGRAICKFDEADQVTPAQVFMPGTDQFLQRVIQIQNAETCHFLREDLTDHVVNNNIGMTEDENVDNMY